MTMLPRSAVRATVLASAALALSLGPLTAQDRFGRAVAVVGDEVLVTKPTFGRGPAAVYAFARGSDGTWRQSGRVTTPGTREGGEALGQTLALGPDGSLLVGSGDPELRFAAHRFVRDSGEWRLGTSMGLAAASSADAPSGPIDFGTVMRILQPPTRVVAVDERRAAVAVIGGTPAVPAGVRIIEPSGDGWSVSATIEPPNDDAAPSFGAALVLIGVRLWVGAPRAGVAGQVFIYERAASGAWSLSTTLEAPDLGRGAGFGSALAVDGSTIWVGATGSAQVPGAAVAYAAGAVSEVARVLAPGGRTATAFGSALAATDGELWVGAPSIDGGSGRVYRFARSEDGSWSEAPLPSLSGEADWELGAAVALGDGVAVVGAPGADGGLGRAAVLRLGADDSWGLDGWVSPGGDLTTVAGAEVVCADGEAAGFECDNVDLLAYLPLSAIGASPGERVSDVWGWADPETGHEYALVGRTAGAAVVDISNPSSPVYVGLVPGNPSGARDLKVYQDHLFFTGDGAGAHGLLVFDLNHLRDVTAMPTTFQLDARYDGITSAHNLVIDTEAGFAYPVGASGGGETCGGGLHMIDIREPKAPTFAGCFTDTEGLIWKGRTHDAQCVIYQGPDEPYQGHQLCFASNETALRIIDLTDKEAPEAIGTATYPGLAYVHQGWLTDDHRYYYLDDELDELVGTAPRTKTLIWDVTELEEPILVGEILGPDGATDHNLFVKGDRMYQANYQAGLRVLDISDPENPVEIGYFDTTPYGANPPGFVGAWTAYPYFESGSVVVSSMYEGVFVLRPRGRALIP